MSLFSKDVHYRNYRIFCNGQQQHYTYAKQLTATLVKVFAELLSSESCRNDSLFVRRFRFLSQRRRRCWPDVIWQWTFNEAIHQDEQLACNNYQHWLSIKPNQKSYDLSQNVPTISKCPNYLKMSQLIISKCPNFHQMVNLCAESKILEELFP